MFHVGSAVLPYQFHGNNLFFPLYLRLYHNYYFSTNVPQTSLYKYCCSSYYKSLLTSHSMAITVEQDESLFI